MADPLRVLFVEDNPNDVELTLWELARAGFKTDWRRVDTEAGFLDHLHDPLDIIISDYSMPQFDGGRALRLLKESGREIPFILVSGTIGEDVAVAAMREGASDYLLKDRLVRLGPSVRQALDQHRLRRERQELEEQIRQSQKMEAAGRLAAGVVHDFNNMLMVIQGYATLLQQDAIEAGEATREISLAVERATALSRQLLNFGRKQVMQPRILDLNAVVAELANLLRRSLGEDITLEVKAAADLPMIRADQGMLEQVVLNLALNARDAMPNGGQLRIATSVMTIRAEEAEKNPELAPGLAVCLQVDDTGSGMPPEISARVFEPFFTTKASSKGTGLGLATVQAIVKQHRGWIRLHSTVGQGTVFEIVLPASKTPAKSGGGGRPGATERGGRETILVVDDEPTLRSMMRRALQHFGYEVLEASSGRQALALVEHIPQLDLLLADMVLPDGMSGQELADQMRARMPGLRALYTSSYSIESIRQSPTGSEKIHFLQKPYLMPQLAKAVRDCLNS